MKCCLLKLKSCMLKVQSSVSLSLQFAIKRRKQTYNIIVELNQSQPSSCWTRFVLPCKKCRFRSDGFWWFKLYGKLIWWFLKKTANQNVWFVIQFEICSKICIRLSDWLEVTGRYVRGLFSSTRVKRNGCTSFKF